MLVDSKPEMNNVSENQTHHFFLSSFCFLIIKVAKLFHLFRKNSAYALCNRTVPTLIIKEFQDSLQLFFQTSPDIIICPQYLKLMKDGILQKFTKGVKLPGSSIQLTKKLT